MFPSAPYFLGAMIPVSRLPTSHRVDFLIALWARRAHHPAPQHSRFRRVLAVFRFPSSPRSNSRMSLLRKKHVRRPSLHFRLLRDLVVSRFPNPPELIFLLRIAAMWLKTPVFFFLTSPAGLLGVKTRNTPGYTA